MTEKQEPPIRIGKKLYDELFKVSSQFHLTIKHLAVSFIEIGLKYNVHLEGWEKKLINAEALDLAREEYIQKRKRNLENLESLENACEFLDCLLDGFFYCIQMEGKIRKLGSGELEDALKICVKCRIRKGFIKDNQLVKKLKNEGVETQFYYCSKGGEIDTESGIIKCPEMRGEEIKFSNCLIINGGLRCPQLKLTKQNVKIK
jgi:hypothetical protein